MPVAKRYSPSGVSFKRWQAAGNSRSCTSSIRLLDAILLSVSLATRDRTTSAGDVATMEHACTPHPSVDSLSSFL